MKELVNLRLPKKLGTFVSLRDVINQSVQARHLTFMSMSAYPRGSAAVGLIMSMIKLNSYATMLESIKKLRDLCRFAYDIINTNTLMRVDKMPLNRTELLAYIDMQASDLGIDLSFEDKNFISYIIVSGDAAEGAWVLECDERETNLFRQFHKLYSSVRDAGAFTINTNGDLNDPDPSTNVIYNSEEDKIEKISDSKRMRDAAAAFTLRMKGKEQDQIIRDIATFNDEYTGAITIHSLASLRVIDHVMCLLMDIDIWKSFITPRKDVSPSANMERAKGLRTLSSYCHSILMYQQIFSLELFMGTYNKLQGWIMTFPELPEHVIRQYEANVRKFDVLDAQGDANEVLRLLDDTNNPAGSNIVGIPREGAFAFGFSRLYGQIADVESKAVQPLQITQLKELKDPKYAYYMLNHPVGEFRIQNTLIQAVITGEIVAGQIRIAAVGVLNGVPRYYSDEVLSRLTSLSIKVPFRFCQPIPSVDKCFATTTAQIEGGAIKYALLAPAHSYAYEYYLRHDKLLEIFKASTLVDKTTGYLPELFINRDVAKYLRSAITRDFKSLYPSKLIYGDQVHSPGHYSAALGEVAKEEALKRLFETMTGISYPIIKSEIGSEFIKKIYATYLSSFALLYVAPTDTMKGLKGKELVAATTKYLVTGYGFPYGCTYDMLANKQPAPKEEDFIQITPDVCIRFLKNVPKPVEDFKYNPDFVDMQPYYYYSCNSEMMEVNEWLMDDGALHFAMAPISTRSTKPFALLDKVYGYLNDRLVQQTSLNYSLTGLANADDNFSIPLSENAWPYDKYKYHLKYIKFSNYSTSTSSAAGVESTDINKLVTEMEVSMQQAKKESTPARIHEASTNALHTPVEVTKLEEKSSNPGPGKKKKSKDHKPSEDDTAEGLGDDKIDETV